MTEHPDLFLEAERFIEQCFLELGDESAMGQRLQEIKHEIAAMGYYQHTSKELQYGARVAWRNSNRCIGRLFWQSLHVFDCRHLETEEAVFDALIRHIRFATNDGNIRPTITVFKPGIRIWNRQLISYSACEIDGKVIGDPITLELTQECMKLGWRGATTDFDILPLVIQFPNRPPRLFEIPDQVIREVPLRHPEFDWFAALHLKWYAVPIISDMDLEIGGITYTAAPFSGWYMETEIGARDLADTFRYDVLPKVASSMGLDCTRNDSLWKDKALITLNEAVLHSFHEDNVRIVDHHTAAEQFDHFERIEKQQGRTITGDWTWLIPPLSPATTGIFHRGFSDEIRKPNFFYRDTKPWN